jgi:MFS superfamily sulfate permease-like transporter
MNAKQLGLGIVFADFAVLSGYAVYHYGYVGIFQAMTANAATLQVLADLVISLGLVSLWIWRDARSRGESALPWVVLTAVFGSLGALLYLIRREARTRTTSRARVPQAVRA